MLKIPEQKHRPNIRCVLIDLLEGVALEEMAISHLLNAEAEKIQAFVGPKLDFPSCKNTTKIVEFCRLSSQFIDKLIMKQWLLQNRLNKIMELNYSCATSFFCKTENTGYCDSTSDCECCTKPLMKFCDDES